MSTQQVTYLTAEEYLELDAENEFRSEFADGQMFAMADPSGNHSWIVSNTLIGLGSQLLGRPGGARTTHTRLHKFGFYRALPSFFEYLVLDQDAIRAEHYFRQPDASWLLREFTAPADIIEMRTIGCRLELQALYERVQFDAEVQAPE